MRACAGPQSEKGGGKGRKPLVDVSVCLTQFCGENLLREEYVESFFHLGSRIFSYPRRFKRNFWKSTGFSYPYRTIWVHGMDAVQKLRSIDGGKEPKMKVREMEQALNGVDKCLGRKYLYSFGHFLFAVLKYDRIFAWTINI